MPLFWQKSHVAFAKEPYARGSFNLNKNVFFLLTCASSGTRKPCLEYSTHFYLKRELISTGKENQARHLKREPDMSLEKRTRHVTWKENQARHLTLTSSANEPCKHASLLTKQPSRVCKRTLHTRLFLDFGKQLLQPPFSSVMCGCARGFALGYSFFSSRPSLKHKRTL